MARPTKKILNTVIKVHKVILILMGAHEKAKVENLYADIVSQGATMKQFFFPDFHSPTIEDYIKFFAMYDQIIEENPAASPLMHCGAGNGRTGTMGSGFNDQGGYYEQHAARN